MSLINYTKHFSEKMQGPSADSYLLKSVVKPLRDPALSEQDREQISHLNSMTQKKLMTVCAFCGSSEENKGLLLANIANNTHKNVVFVSKNKLKHLATSDLAKLFADTQVQNAIIFFEHADELINGHCKYSDARQKIDFEMLFTIVEKHQGTTIFSIEQHHNIDKLKARHVILLHVN